MRYRHDFDIMFVVSSDKEDPDELTPQELRRACQARLDGLSDDEIREACGHVETVEDDHD